MRHRNFLDRLTNLKILFFFYIGLTLIVSFAEIAKGNRDFGGRNYPHYNNYLIFSKSFYHLIEKKDLYTLFPDEHWDLFKYSPTFALLMGFFAIFPEHFGLILWNLLNSLLPFFAIKSINLIDERRRAYILWFIVIDTVTSMQNSQSNGLIAGLLILAFVFFEKRKIHLSALFLVLSLFVKPIGFVSFFLFLLYPKKFKFLLFSLIFAILFLLLPILSVTPSHLYFLYKSWMNLLMRDYSLYEGLSVFGILKKWFGLSLSKQIVIFSGIFLFLLPFLRKKLFEKIEFRFLLLSSSLIWAVIFNHKAESPTFVIATCGVAIWYFYGRKRVDDLLLLIFYFLITSISSTDLTPLFLKEKFLKPYLLKALPSILVWIKIQMELLFSKFESEETTCSLSF
jgi:hypothetical protein